MKNYGAQIVMDTVNSNNNKNIVREVYLYEKRRKYIHNRLHSWIQPIYKMNKKIKKSRYLSLLL